MQQTNTQSPLDALTPALRRQLHRHCARMTGSFFDGEDVLQEAMLKAHDAIGREPVAVTNPAGWLFRIAHHTALDFLRRRRRDPVQAVEDDFLAQGSTPCDEAERRWAVQAGLRHFLSLTPAQRGAVILVDVLEHPLDDAAVIMDRTLPATKSSLLRGRRQLQAALEQPSTVPVVDREDADISRLSDYAKLFNERHFDLLRDLLADHVRADVVGAATLDGKTKVAQRYFGNYATQDVRAHPVLVDGRSALLLSDQRGRRYIVALEFSDGRVAAISDFRHTGYELEPSLVLPIR